jgi:hypothetical protein
MSDERQGQDPTAPAPGSGAFPFPPSPRGEHDASISQPEKKPDVLFWAGVGLIAFLLLVIAASLWRILDHMPPE